MSGLSDEKEGDIIQHGVSKISESDMNLLKPNGVTNYEYLVHISD